MVDLVLQAAELTDGGDCVGGVDELVDLLVPPLAALLLLVFELFLDELLLQPVFVHLVPHDALESLLFGRQDQLVDLSVGDVGEVHVGVVGLLVGHRVHYLGGLLFGHNRLLFHLQLGRLLQL